MNAMSTEVYDALRSVGVDEAKAKAAAAAMFNHDIATRGDIVRLEKRIIGSEKDIQFMKWGICAIILMLVAEAVSRFFS